MVDYRSIFFFYSLAFPFILERKSSPRLQSFDDTFHGGDLETLELTGTDNIEAGLEQLVNGLERSLTGRFDDMNGEVQAAMRILCFSYWPQEHEVDEGNLIN